MDGALEELRDSRSRWRAIPLEEKARLLDDARARLAAAVRPWAETAAALKGISPDARAAGEEWLYAGFLMGGMRFLARSLEALAAGRAPRIPGRIRTLPGGQLAVNVFPESWYDRLFFPGLRVEVWTEPGVDRETMAAETVARFHDRPAPRTVLVLGAGNISVLGPSDLIDKLFVDEDVAVYKPNPLCDPLTPFIEEVFRGVIDAGALRIVTGGAAEGAYLASHPLVDAIHMTASARTYDAVVFGTGEDGAARKIAGERLIEKPVTAELGNVSPVIVVPGPWSTSDVAYQGEHLAGMQVVNAGCNCVTTRLIIQHRDWELRDDLLDAIRAALAHAPTRPAFYPGADATQEAFAAAHPEAERFGRPPGGHLPWMLIPGVDPAGPDVSFNQEPFCPLFSETALEGRDAADFLDRAVRFVNERVWGTLGITILVHPASLRDRRVAEAVERAVVDLRYGVVCVNVWALINWGIMGGAWGAFPGHPPEDIQSGAGKVHNYLMLPRPQKTVLRAPFRQWPKPLPFPIHRTLLPLGRRLAPFLAEPSLRRLPGIVTAAARG